nr:MAG TPA: hypothetical protein [Caudoviricetes sp.]
MEEIPSLSFWARIRPLRFKKIFIEKLMKILDKRIKV